MNPLWLLLLLLLLRTAELRSVQTEDAAGMEAPLSAGMEAPLSAGMMEAPLSAGMMEAPLADSDAPDHRVESFGLKREPRGAKDGSFRRGEPLSKSSPPRRLDDPSGFFTTTTPRSLRHASAPPLNSSSGRGSGAPGLLNPLFPVTDGSVWAYAVLLLALVLFAAGIVGNLALMCIVWHNVYLKSAWNFILAGLALWDFLVLFFCLPVVIFHELTMKRLLGDASCRLVPYLEVTSLGVATFSLCALSIDRFHAATGPAPHQAPKVEPCGSILSKVGVVWVGSMVLAAPELLLWQLLQEPVGPLALTSDLQQGRHAASLMAALRTRGDVFKVDVCIRTPSLELPESVLALVLTYQEARVWWIFGCYLCLPLLFTLACDLVTRRVLSQRLPRKPAVERAAGSSSSAKKRQQHVRERRRRSAVMALTVLYVACNLPHSVSNVVLSYVSVPVLVPPALALVEQFLLFARCSATPVLLLCLCRPLGRAFVDCCCCCCEECLPDTGSSSSSSSASTAATSALSSPTSPSPTSLFPPSREEAITSGSAAEPDREKDPAEAVGTPC